MQTLEIQCGSCMQVMGVSVEHLGAQVHCPHCQAVVQVPDAAAFGLTAPTPPQQTPPVQESAAWTPPPPPVQETVAWTPPPQNDHEDIFAPPAAGGDDIFGGATPPQLPAFPPAGFQQPTYQQSTYQTSAPAPSYGGGYHQAAEHEEEPVRTVKRDHRPSMVAPMILIFLVPYSLATTGFAAYLFTQSTKDKGFDPLLDLKDGSRETKQIKHDLEVPSHLRFGLNETNKLGDLEITPFKVSSTPIGDFVLHLKVTNRSEKMKFVPTSDALCAYRDNMAAPRPYTFLEIAGSKSSLDRLYGGAVQWLKDGNPIPLDDGMLKPGETMNILIGTRAQDRTLAKRLLAGPPTDMLWRVHIRRGMMDTRDGNVSATAVFGVPFNTSGVDRAVPSKEP